jgi:DNA invertase Pin-like site-specific DNA recombinase
MRAAVYLRISQDRTGQELGVERQWEDTFALLTRRGDTLVGKYVDNDTPAKGVGKRDEYARLIAAVQAGEVDRIYVWSQGRLWRNRVERAQGFEILREARVSLIQVKGPEVDMTTAMGRMIAGIIGEFDTGENEIKAERQVRESLQRADSGLPPGGRRAFGYDATGAKKVRREAEAVKKAYAALLAGTTLSKIARDMNEAGHRTTVGGPVDDQRRAGHAAQPALRRAPYLPRPDPRSGDVAPAGRRDDVRGRAGDAHRPGPQRVAQQRPEVAGHRAVRVRSLPGPDRHLHVPGYQGPGDTAARLPVPQVLHDPRRRPDRLLRFPGRGRVPAARGHGRPARQARHPTLHRCAPRPRPCAPA